jgi:hydrogenase/urease accessory protein HupE
MLSLLRIASALLLLGFSDSVVRAHDAGLSVVEVRTRADTLELSVSYALADVQRMLPPSVRLGTDSSSHTIEAAQAELDQLASLLWDVHVDDRPLVPNDVRIAFTPSDNLGFHFIYPRPEAGMVVFRSANLGALPSTHRELFRFFDEKGRSRKECTLNATDNAASVSMKAIAVEPVATSETNPPVKPAFRDFFVLGIEHIWTGYDHLLFLFGLLIVCRSFRSIIAIISCFTLAHSITLGLAALDIVNVPSWLVEPLIAGSIVFVGVENLLRRGAEPRGRGWLAFGFGLIHGFGFASVLRDLGVGANGGEIALPLLSFNLGVETGQVCVAAVVLPVLARLFRSDTVRRRCVPAASTVIASAGFYWLIERTLLN